LCTTTDGKSPLHQGLCTVACYYCCNSSHACCILSVHFHNRPERWDEWISFDSPRVAPFRSRTVHSTLSPYVSPTPNVTLARAPITGANDLRTLLPEVARMFRTLQPAIEAAAALAEEVSSGVFCGSALVPLHHALASAIAWHIDDRHSYFLRRVCTTAPPCRRTPMAVPHQRSHQARHERRRAGKVPTAEERRHPPLRRRGLRQRRGRDPVVVSPALRPRASHRECPGKAWERRTQ
jgi:hypothetical protein